ncbi:MAG: hypothetical protein Q8K58_15450 [Acidimicrobiales bacterium]|nr:hypothetical protein [Acidimicrobiales bacterium]
MDATPVRTRVRCLLVAAVLVVAAACGGGRDVGAIAPDGGSVQRTITSTTAASTTAAPTTTVTPPRPPPPTTAAPPPPAPSTSSTGPHPARVVARQAWVPYANVGPVVLHHPSDRVEAIGFHQSSHDGAQAQVPTPAAVRWFTMGDRDRDTTAEGAADLVVEPGFEIRAPVTGTVLRAGSYTLYCNHVDQYAVIEPEARPGWEVKVLHVEGLALVEGQRVEAGVTALAAHARVLPFPSQVEDHTGVPAWPHVHVEVVDPTVPDRPTGPGCD